MMSVSTTSSAPFLLALGDSLTAGYGLAPQDALPARLEALLQPAFPGAQVLNAGISGNTSGDALRRLPRLLTSLRRRPDLAIVELGANDLIRRVDPAIVLQNLGLILEELARCGIPAMLATLALPTALSVHAAEYSSIYSDLASRYHVPAYPLFPPEVLGRQGFVLRDRIHPNAAAIDRAARHIAPVVIEELRRAIARQD